MMGVVWVTLLCNDDYDVEAQEWHSLDESSSGMSLGSVGLQAQD